MTKLPDEFIQTIRDLPILDVASDYVSIEKTGRVHQATCIHAGDKTPSLTFFPSTNTFYCFGCGAGKKPMTDGSNTIAFVMWMENCSFLEAVEKLAEKNHLDMPKRETTPEEAKHHQALETHLNLSRDYWIALQSQPEVLSYLHERGIEKPQIDAWRLGYFSTSEHEQEIGKLVFPLLDESGKTVGFSYRDLTEELKGVKRQGPKYMNSKNSSIFDKGSLLYGLHLIKPRIQQLEYMVIGEGYADAMMAQKAGLPFVSTMGTSLTEQQVSLIARYTKRVVLWMDGDRAGIQASLRNAHLLRSKGIVVRILNVPGADPDEVLWKLIKREEDPEEAALAFVEREAQLASHYQINEMLGRYEAKVMELKTEALDEIQEVLENINSQSERALATQLVKQRLSLFDGNKSE